MYNFHPSRLLNQVLNSLLIGCCVAMIVAPLTLILPNRYISTAHILPVDTKGLNPGLSTIVAAAAAVGVNNLGLEGADSSLIDVLSSRSIKEQLLLSSFTYQERSWRFATPITRTTNFLSYLNVKNIDSAIIAMDGNVKVSRDLKTRLLTITAETTSPELSQALVNRLIELLENYSQERGRTRGGAKAQFASARLKELQENLDLAEMKLGAFLQLNRNFQSSNDPIVRLHGARLESEWKLKQQLLISLSMNREQALLEEKNDMPILNILDNGNLPINPSGPKRLLITIALLVFSFATSMAYQSRATLIGLMSRN